MAVEVEAGVARGSFAIATFDTGVDETEVEVVL